MTTQPDDTVSDPASRDVVTTGALSGTGIVALIGCVVVMVIVVGVIAAIVLIAEFHYFSNMGN